MSHYTLFFDYVREKGLNSALSKKYAHPFLGFAEILKRRGCTKVLVGQVEDENVIGNIVIYVNRYGLGMTIQPEDNWGIGIFDTYPLQKLDDRAEFVIGDENDFFDDESYKQYEDAVKNKIASIGLNFHTKS